jgi:hypothetical protein
MARPRLPLGTMGEIRYQRTANGRVRAVTQSRDYDGRTRQVERTGPTEAAARRRLAEACRDRGRTDSAAEITPTTTVAALAERWFAQVQAAVDVGDYSPGTSQAYRDRLDKQVVPAAGRRGDGRDRGPVATGDEGSARCSGREDDSDRAFWDARVGRSA